MDGSSDIPASRRWRAGFEVEVVLGDLGDRRFSFERLHEPMDMASRPYCREVARHLSALTGERWTAPGKKRSSARTGFFVVPEYDIDPLHFPTELTAGVELITPPLPLDEAEELRRSMGVAILRLGGWYNLDRNPITDGLGWHINIDAGQKGLEIARFALGVDERAMLRSSGCGGTRYTGTQRHAFGVPLLRELAGPSGPDGMLSTLKGFIHERGGDGTAYAANFSRGRYLELRHFGVREFLDDDRLLDLIGPAIMALQMDNESLAEATRRMVAIFECLRGWLDEIAPRLSIGPRRDGQMIRGSWGCEILFDGEAAGRIFCRSSAEIYLGGARPYSRAATIHRVLAADWKEAVAVLALDIVEDRRAGRAARLESPALSAAIAELRRRLGRARLLVPAAIASGFWWRDRDDDDDQGGVEGEGDEV